MGNGQSRPWIVSDELWSLIAPLLPEPAPKLVEGRPRVPDRQATCGILFVLRTGNPMGVPAQELGFGLGMTCWRRLAAWNKAGVWDHLHAVLLKELRSKNQLNWSRAVIDSSHVRATRPQGPKSGPRPVDLPSQRANVGLLNSSQSITREGTPFASNPKPIHRS
ncbi:transposase [Streptomyces sp. NPDC057199]|uniref:transposase n=1 Tax=Streptomyces sp. NPDC057199 TaxID=3346047 RepID=UPI00362E86E0